MHLLQAQAGRVADGSEAVDLGQSPGEIVLLSAADTELAALAAARAELPEAFPRLRLANLMQLSHNLSVDIYVEEIIAEARLVVVRLLGGISYWPYGIEQIAATCRQRGIKLAVLPGDDNPDAELAAPLQPGGRGLPSALAVRVHGGPENARNLLLYAGDAHRLVRREAAALGRAQAPCCGRASIGLGHAAAGPGGLARALGPGRAGGGHRLLSGLGAGRAIWRRSTRLIEALQAQGVNPCRSTAAASRSRFPPTPSAISWRRATRAWC